MADPTTPAPDFNAIATTQDGRDITRGYVSPMLTMAPTDELLIARGNGNYTLYREVLRDEHVAATFQQRRLALISREWQVEPASAGSADTRAADFIRELLGRLDFDRLTDLMLYGRFYGYAVAECLWARDGAQITVADIRVRDRRRFAFDGAQRLRLRTNVNWEPGELMPERKFWTFCVGADNDDEPYGLGLAHWLYWPVYFKRNVTAFWLVRLERFSAPTLHGTLPDALARDEGVRTKFLQALEAIRTDSAVVTPEGMLIKLIEAARGTDDYTAFYERMNEAIARVVLGQTLSTEARSTGLGSNLATVHNEVRLEAVKADADLICQSFNNQVVRWLTEWNFPGAASPRVWRVIEDPNDKLLMAQRDAKIAALGYRPTAERIAEVYGPGYELAPSSTLSPTPGASPQFAEGDPPPTVSDEQSATLSAALMPTMDDWIGRIRQLVETADSLDAVRDGLLALYPDMKPEAFAQAMGEALVAADLAGRYDILEQASAGG